ncbi:MAG: FtsX-like permease family protein [Clostridiales bacterium]|nr:FtsX-like permease family protein [Clostridiales bacterium]
MKAFRKYIFRTIKNSMGRYLAILSIIALGVGFFSGLKAAKPAMIQTGRDYVSSQSLYDFELISTWGFEEDEILELLSIDGVTVAEGSISQDFIFTDDSGENQYLKALSITEEVNQLTLIAGSLLQAADECVLDAYYYSEDMIGTEIVISEENDEDTLDSFAYTTYTVTGLVRTPLYMNMERGTTTIGDGQIDAFVCIPLDGFSFDYYTEVYLSVENDLLPFSDEYDDLIDDCTSVVEDESDEIIMVRYDEEISDAEQEIADAEQELEEETEKAKQELADALEELEDGEQELADGKAEIEEARETLETSKQELEDAEDQLNDAQDQYDSGLKEYKSGLAQYEDGLEEYNEGYAEYQSGYSQYQSGLSQYNSGLSQYKSGLSQYNEGVSQYESGLSQYESGLSQYESGYAQYEETLAELESSRSQYEQAKEQKEQLESAYSEEELSKNETYLALCQSIAAFEVGEKELSETKATLDATKDTLDATKTQLDATKDTLDATKTTLDATKTQLDASKKTLNQTKKTLNKSKKQLNAAKATLDSSKTQLDAAKKELDAAKAEIASGWEEVEEGKEQIAEAEQELAEAEEEIADAKQELADVEEPEVYVLDRGSNVGYASYENDVSIVEGIARIFPLFFFLIAALVCSTTMTRMIDDDRTQIGTLRALGYTQGHIYANYIIYSGSAAVIGAVAGYFLGSRLFPIAIWLAYNMLYGFADLQIVDDSGLFGISLAASLLCSVGVTCLTCQSTLKEVPAELIRPKAPPAGKRIFLERIQVLWKHLKFLYKVTARNIFRFKKRMIMMIMGIGGCTALVLTGFGVKDSIANIANYEYDEILRYDINAAYTKEISDDILAEIEEEFGEEISDSAVLMEAGVEAVYDGGVKSVTLMVSDREEVTSCIDFHHDGEEVSLPGEGEILIDTRLAEALSLEVGDEIILTSGEKDSEPMIVAGIFENYISYYAYVGSDTYEECFGEDYIPKTIYITLTEESDDYAVASYLADMDDASNMTVVNDMRKRIENMMQSMNYIVILVIGCAAALAFIVLFNLGNINISERTREIATLKVLGFYPRETGAYVFRENLILSMMGIVVGLPLGILLHRFVMMQVKVDMASFEIRILPQSYLFSVAAVLAFTACVDIILRRKIEHIQMAESLKSIE